MPNSSSLELGWKRKSRRAAPAAVAPFLHFGHPIYRMAKVQRSGTEAILSTTLQQWTESQLKLA